MQGGKPSWSGRNVMKKGNKGRKENRDYISRSILKISELDYDQFIENVKEYAKYMKDNGFSTSMIRKVYSKIMKTDSDNIKEIKMLRPQFAYIYGRNQDKRAVRDFMDMLDKAVKDIKSEEEIRSLKEFMEAIVAYLKYYGDRY